MALTPGYKGQLTVTKDGSDTNTVVSTASLVRYALTMVRTMVNVTPLNSSIKVRNPEHTISGATFEGVVDDSTDFGLFNDPELPATLVVLPTGGATQKITITGHVEACILTADVEGVSIIRGRFVGVTAPVKVWS